MFFLFLKEIFEISVHLVVVFEMEHASLRQNVFQKEAHKQAHVRLGINILHFVEFNIYLVHFVQIRGLLCLSRNHFRRANYSKLYLHQKSWIPK